MQYETSSSAIAHAQRQRCRMR